MLDLCGFMRQMPAGCPATEPPYLQLWVPPHGTFARNLQPFYEEFLTSEFLWLSPNSLDVLGLMVMLFHHLIKSTHGRTCYSSSFACHQQGSAVLSQPSSGACSGAFLIYTQSSTEQKMPLRKMHISIPDGASLCRDLPQAGGSSDSAIWGVAQWTWAFVLTVTAIGS